MKKYLLSLLFCCFALVLFAQEETMSYSKIALTSAEAIPQLLHNGVAADHYHADENGRIELIVSASERAVIDDLSIPYTVVTPDMATHYRNTLETPAAGRNADCGLENYDFGSLSGYHSYAEILGHLDSMQANYPELVQVFEIGNSVEDRPIYAVKISDNVAVDESGTEGVAYYDALTHAREPLSMESTIFYMWWLLENYGTDAEATYLTDHREMYFIPVLNPDGYLYNELTNPTGGGLWRKNRRIYPVCEGVDLNRNYGLNWGDLSGSSDDPCTNLYHGTAAFSEPETQAARDLFNQIEPATAFSTHSYSDVMILPNAFDEEPNRFAVYAEYASEFSPAEYKGYGTGIDLIFYSSTGNTRDYMDAAGCIAYTPEVGHEFWEPASVICDRINEMLPAMKYMSWAAGEFTRFNNVDFPEGKEMVEGDPLRFNIRVRNRGMNKTADNVNVTVGSAHPALVPVITSLDYGDVNARSTATNDLTVPFEFLVGEPILLNEPVVITVTVSQDGSVSDVQEIYLYGGAREVLFADDGENGNDGWQSSNAGWDTTALDALSGQYVFADSPRENYSPNQNSTFTMVENVDLSETTDPWLEFNAKWSFDAEADRVLPLISTNNGASFTPLEGIHTNSTFGDPAYLNTSHWVSERISLQQYAGQGQVKIAFRLITSNSRQSDGFYFDDLSIADYSEVDTMVSNTGSAVALGQDIELFPNPVVSHLNLMNKRALGDNVFLQLLDSRARPVLERIVRMESPQTHELDLSGLPAGMYYLKIDNGSRRVYRKVIKQRE